MLLYFFEQRKFLCSTSGRSWTIFLNKMSLWSAQRLCLNFRMSSIQFEMFDFWIHDHLLSFSQSPDWGPNRLGTLIHNRYWDFTSSTAAPQSLLRRCKWRKKTLRVHKVYLCCFNVIFQCGKSVIDIPNLTILKVESYILKFEQWGVQFPKHDHARHE